MKLLQFLGRLFGGGAAASSGSTGDVGIYYYIRCDRCGEVIQVRINPHNDLSQNDDGSGFFVRKTIVGNRCYSRIEAELLYDRNRNLADSVIGGGTLTDREAYEADQVSAAQQG